ncbi:DEAD-box ATP-dependent RNA helicase 1 [Andrographis paniculata]|uniref:DEAD-box ATP-dependent RNA helicase 1 n=1 Tax=Andrographis paniculata TaxID=175694 RepID=UPI0021E7461B|nr:DEAD-box ATP-dependent RNA helicase 1 [Andrographis paniculata]XP_051128622.1 DEAD-box ATP-dependent RNA helicase 1 [Andrographis paniculata]
MESAASEQDKSGNSLLVPWMRKPVDVSDYEPRPLNCVPRLDPRMQAALQNMGITSLFPVQLSVWTEIIGPGCCDRDLCISSPTGSGKTLAYALPIVHMLSKYRITALRALVVLPTRDLAVQVKEVFDSVAPAMGLSVGLAVGQSSISDEISKLVKKPKLDFGICSDNWYSPPELRSRVDILVATPGRLMDHINNTEGFTLEHLHYLVVDETDRLLRDDYHSWLPNVLKSAYSCRQSQFPLADGIAPPIYGSLKTIRSCGVEGGFLGKPHPRLVKLVLSATLTQDPSKLAVLDLHHPLLLAVGMNRYQLPDELKSCKVICESKLKPLYLLALLKSLQGEKCIVFTKSVESTHRLCTLLNLFDDLPIKTEEYSSRQLRHIRSNKLKGFREGLSQVLISSDAMARGMDVEGVKNVINYDMPNRIKTYIHRAGRTARAGQNGCCFTFLNKDQVKQFKMLLQKAGCESCPNYPVPLELVESLRSTYDTALQRLKESVESESNQKMQH